MGESIQDLLEQIKHKEIVLPEFQREFTWSKTQVRKLFESIFKKYPTGSLLVWVTDNPPKIKMDAFDLEKIRRVKVLLDGQQRLTSLYLHIHGKIPPYYSLEEISDDYFDLYFNVKNGGFGYYKKVEMERDPLWIKLTDIYNSRPSIYSLVAASNVDDSKEKEKLFEQIEHNISRLEGILGQEYPVQSVPSDASVREAITVFDLINSQGTPLTQSDIVLAYMTAEWPDIRRVFKEKIYNLKISNFSFDLTFMTRCMVGIVNGVGDLNRYGEVTESDLKKAWKKLDKALEYLISFLHHKAYIIGDSDLNTTNVLVPLVVYLARHDWFTQANESMFLYWMYAALFKRRYSGSVDTKLDQDITALLDEPGPNALLINLKDDEGDPSVSPANLDMRGVGHPLYNMMSIVIRANGAVDWGNGLPLLTTNATHFSIQRHHIFPKSILEKSGWDTGNNLSHRKRVHEIANRIPLTQQGNLDIFDDPPAEYLIEVNIRYPDTLRHSLIPQNTNLWRIENYEEFLEQRRVLIANAINDYMEKLRTSNVTIVDVDVKTLIMGGENNELEFKARFHGGRGNYNLEMAVVKAVAGMLNAHGGKVIIGVTDDCKVVGLETDYAKQGKKNRDGFEIELTNQFLSKIGVNVLPLLRVKFEFLDGHDICILNIDPSSRPVYVKYNSTETFFVRMQNSTRPLNMSETTSYIRDHFNQSI
jgi:hypothetical protein